LVRCGRRAAGGWHGSARTLGRGGATVRRVCARQLHAEAGEKRDRERRGPNTGAREKKEEGWRAGSGSRVEGRRAWGQRGGGPVGRRGWAVVGTARQRARGRGVRLGWPRLGRCRGPAQHAQCHFAINQGFLGQIKLQTIKSWSYVAPKFQIKYKIVGN
jgi:hypothetical protein